jgi:RNA polymerase sigma factor (sigma-70 family)
MRTRANEVKLLNKCLEGDTKAFEVIIAKYQELVCAITYSGISDVQKSEELAHQTFINAWNKLSQLGDLCKFRPWLCSIARNHVKSFIRKNKRDILQKSKPMEHANSTPIEESGPLESAITKEHMEIVDAAIGQIPEQYRESLVLYYRQQQSVRQVAQSLDLSEELVKKRLQRGRMMIKEQISSIVEKTLSATGPKKTFASAIIASIAGMAVKGSGVAAAAGIATASSATGTATGVAGVMSGVAAKIITTAAVVVIGIGAVVTYKQVSKSSLLPDSTYTPVAVEEVEEVPVVVEEEMVGPSYEETAVASVADEIKTNSKDQEPVVKSVEPEPVGTEDAEFEFKARGVLSGLLTDVATGDPVTDAQVHISTPFYHSTSTDANGFYSFESVLGYGDCGMTVFSKRYVGITDWDREGVLLEEGKQAVRHFELERGCQIQLRVVNEAGEPVEKARFVSTWLADKDKRYVGDRNSRDRTDADGYVLLGGFAPADTPYLIATTHRVEGEMAERRGIMMHMSYRDYAPEPLEVTLTDPNAIQHREIVLKKGLEVRGYAEYMDGVPAGDMRIGSEPDWWHSHNVPESYPVDANGYFTLKYVVPDTYSIHGHFPEDEDGSVTYLTVKEAELPPEEGELLVVTIPERSPGSLASISGKVTFADGVKPEHILITAQSPQLKTGLTDIGKDRSGNFRDEFVIDRLEPGVYRLRFSGDGIEEKTVRNVQAPSDGLVIELAGKKKVNLRGKVVEETTGEAITDFKVMAYGQRDWVHVSDAEGQFDIEVTGSEDRKVVVAADGYASKVSEPIVPDSNEWVVIELGIGGAIEGRIVDEYGGPIEGGRISYHYKQSRDESPDAKLITTSDANGLFVIDEIPLDRSQHWYVFEHADYAMEMRLIEVEGDAVVETEVVLSRGGSVEGHVYGEKGQPVAGTTVYFMDEPHFSYWNENRRRLCAVRTDEQGYYRIDHLPERLCFGFRGDPDKPYDATLMSILPRRGEVRRLDFGGQWRAVGRLLRDGEPLTDTKMMLLGNTDGHETAFTAYARTDSQGQFILRGMPSGRRYFYWAIPGLRSSGRWSEIGLFDFSSGVDLDLGDIEVFLGQVGIEVTAEKPNETLGQLEISIQRYSEKEFWGRRAGRLLPRSGANDKYVFSNLTSGIYEVIAKRQSYPSVRKVFTIERGQYEHEIDLLIPAGSSSLSGKIVGSESARLMLRNVDQTLTMEVVQSADGSYAIENLPADDYIIGRARVALGRQSKIKEVSLKSGENKTLDIEVESIGRKDGGYLVVMVVTEGGLPLAGAKAWLGKGGDIIEPHFDSDKSKSFAGDAGEYVLYAEYPGYIKIQQRVNIKPKEGLSTQEILEPLVITMSK